MLNNDYIAYAIVTVGIFTFYMAMMHLFRSGSQSRVSSAADALYTAADAETGPPVLAQLCEMVLSVIRIDPAAHKKITQSLARAGINDPYATTYFLFVRWIVQPIVLLLGLVTLLSTFATPGIDDFDMTTNLLTALLFIVFGVNGAALFVTNQKTRRQKILELAFPEMMDLLLVCIEAGLGLDAALNRVCKELRSLHPEIVTELDRTRLELTILNDRVVALENLADRAEIVPFRILVSALIQTEKFGTSLVDTLRILSEEQRLVRLSNAEQRAGRIPVLISIPLILFILPAFITIILGPPIIKVINSGGLFNVSNSHPH